MRKLDALEGQRDLAGERFQQMSLLTELVIALVVRTRRPFFRSRPGNLLLISTLVLDVLTIAIPYLPFVTTLGFVSIPSTLLATMLAITGLYVLATEMTKHWFYRAMG